MDINSLLIRNLLFPLMGKLKGNKIQANTSYLQTSQHSNHDEITLLQQDKLRRLLLYCIENVPAYRPFSHFSSQIKGNPIEALEKLPVLTKQEFRKSSSDYLCCKTNKESLIPNRTGGSTGEPVQFYMDRHTVEFYEAARWRGLSWWDIRIGDRSAMIWGSPIELSQSKRASYKIKERFLKNRIMIPAYDLNPDSIDEYIDVLNKFKPSYFYGYASSLYLFARLMLQANKPLTFKPKAAVSTAETLYNFQREVIEKAFNCMTVNEYGARDGGILAYECPNRKMHISSENAYIEIVDVETKKPVEKGKSGLVLVTDLNNFVMPRLRYQLGDVAALSTDNCACGIGLPILEKIEGREDDIFVSQSGSYVHGHFFNHIARNLEGIKQFQIVQSSRTKSCLRVIRSENYRESDIQRFKEEIIKVMGAIDLTIEFVENIPLSNSGKIRYAIREFPLSV